MSTGEHKEEELTYTQERQKEYYYYFMRNFYNN